MDNVQIEYALQHDAHARRCFIGVFPVNGLPPGPMPWPSALVITARSVPAMTTNHWVALYITPDGEGEVYDSLGNPPQHPMLRQFLRRNTVRTVYNRVRIQSLDSAVCGHHVLFFLLQRCRGFHPNYILYNFCPDQALNDAFVEHFARPLLIPPSNVPHL